MRARYRAWLTGMALVLIGCGRIGFERLGADGGPDLDGAPLLRDGEVVGLDGATRVDARVVLPDGAVVPADAGGVNDGSVERSDGGGLDGGGVPPPTTGARITRLSAAGADDRDPDLRADQLEIFFSSNRSGGAGGMDLWRSTRASSGSDWGSPTAVTELNTAGTEAGPSLSRDGRTLFFERDGDLYRATRSDLGAAFGTPAAHSELNSGQYDGFPTLTADGLSIVFCSSRRGGTRDLHTAARPSVGEPFGVVNYLNQVSSSTSDTGPHVGAAGGLRLLHASDRPGGAGGFDLYVSARDTTGAAFPDSTPVGPNAAANEVDPWLSDDGTLLYYASDAGGDYDIFAASL